MNAQTQRPGEQDMLMNKPPRSRRHAGWPVRMRVFAIGATALVALLGGMLLVSVGQAQAYSLSTAGLYPGTATTPKVTVDPASPFDLSAGYVTSHARRVYESPSYATSNQWVCLTHRLWRWQAPYVSYGVSYPSRWLLSKTSGAQCGWIAASGTSITDAGHAFRLQMADRNQYLTTDVVVTWQLSNGAVLGKRIYSYNNLADYICNRSCDHYGYADGVGYIGVM